MKEVLRSSSPAMQTLE
jgi:hypothetical protein